MITWTWPWLKFVNHELAASTSLHLMYGVDQVLTKFEVRLLNYVHIRICMHMTCHMYMYMRARILLCALTRLSTVFFSTEFFNREKSKQGWWS